ncbi:MAG: pyridoxamine kinase [Oscillospiraceae bacterium]|nr:pyridoxamine kinase [Oscillospiraceae bacterium]
MTYKRILTIQDISCLGQCSLTVALPILSACGQEACIMPSAVLSTHTGGFRNFTFCDLTEEMPKIAAHWINEGIRFDCIYTGYLGSKKQIDYVIDIFRSLLAPGGKIVVDPAMADNGRLYTGFDDAFALEMARLCPYADVILPNWTEACFLTGRSYREDYTPEEVTGMMDALQGLGAKSVVITGIGYDPAQTGVAVRSEAGDSYYAHHRFESGFHGTGDVYSAAFVGAWTSGKGLEESARIAADYTLSCIALTKDDPNHWYGVKFEAMLPKLIEELQK